MLPRATQGRICVILEAELRAGSPVSPGNRDSQAGGRSGTEEAGQPQTCCLTPTTPTGSGTGPVVPFSCDNDTLPAKSLMGDIK